MKKFKKVRVDAHPFIWIFIACLALLGVVQLVRAATGGIQGQPGVTKYDAAGVSDSIVTSNDSYVDMPGMSVSFLTTETAPAVIHVSVATPLQYTPSFNGCFYLMRAVIDGTPMSDEVPITFLNLETRGFTFVTPSLSIGTHTATIQWRPKVSYFGQPGCTQARSMVVEHQ